MASPLVISESSELHFQVSDNVDVADQNSASNYSPRTRAREKGHYCFPLHSCDDKEPDEDFHCLVAS